MDLRLRVRAIQADNSLTETQKHAKMQALMTERWRSARAIEGRTIAGSCTTFHDDEKRILGCKHYRRKCKIVAPCCQKVYPCRICHDEVEDHRIDRFAAEKMVCMGCQVEQPIAKHCSNRECDVNELAAYYCHQCKFHDDDPGKQIYHCDKCGMCRKGRGIGIDYSHCDGCNACIGIKMFDSHVCIERSLESNCPICHEFLFTSVESIIFMQCGHPIHAECYRSYIRTSYTCPLCMKSVMDMSSHYSRVDQYVQSLIIPEELQNTLAFILCNDCLHKSYSPYRIMYHKCEQCQSFNTSVLSILRDC